MERRRYEGWIGTGRAAEQDIADFTRIGAARDWLNVLAVIDLLSSRGWLVDVPCGETRFLPKQTPTSGARRSDIF
ncbi:MAG: hypothetical protein JWO48_3758 [Bryobacterales bacterium]|nr:hypothetical protein [Bryobacterales bacterium]